VSFDGRDLSSIRAGNLSKLLPEALRPRDPELRSNSLGMTETCAAHTADRSDVDLPEASRGSFGKPVPGVEHKIVDPETGETLAAGAEGEICVRGRSLLQALYKVEREETFDADGYYHTGDGGYFNSDGALFFTGRLGEMIKTGGANVTPSEVEAALEAFPEVEMAHVVGLPDPTRGQDVAAAVVPVSGASLEAEELRTRLRPVLSAYKLPRHLFLLKSDELPLTDTGKIDKRGLAQELAARLARDPVA
jgi:acyl-CoA synthetase (AMP-forming)/AMP-acid ligase II